MLEILIFELLSYKRGKGKPIKAMQGSKNPIFLLDSSLLDEKERKGMGKFDFPKFRFYWRRKT